MTVRVEGLKELRKELKVAGDAFPKEMQRAAKTVSELVAEGTRTAFSSMAGSAPKVAATVKAYASATRAYVKVGGGGDSVAERVAMGNLWGSSKFPQFPGRTAEGHALFPTIKARNDEIVDVYGDMVDDLLKRAFPD